VFSSAIGVYYYLRPIVYMYMSESDSDVLASPAREQQLSRIAVIICTLLVITTSLFPSLFYDFIRKGIIDLF